MPCAFCGEGDRWIKTCRTGNGSCLRVCDPCWEALGSWLVVRKYSGTEVKLDGEDHRIVDAEDILGVVEA